MKNPKKILIIIQRSNGDVFLSSSLIKSLYEQYQSPQIDILINDDTFAIASLIPYIRKIYTFSYQQKQDNRWKQEKDILTSLFRKYDLSINLTASDRSVIYALISGKKSISAVENHSKKSWWKKIFLTHYYYFDNSKHILRNNLEPLNLLKINFNNVHYPIEVSSEATFNVKKKLEALNVGNFVIFHPSAQYHYKIFPQYLRDELLSNLSKLGISVLITGSHNKIDLVIKQELPTLNNVFDFIGETTLEEYFALSELSMAYVGMDTLNMHIAASQNKRIFVISGPTNLKMWSPWSNQLKRSASHDMPIQTYGDITIFQANMKCVACGKAGCDDSGISKCLNNINPKIVFEEVREWYKYVGS